jgi:hypothetical protein
MFGLTIFPSPITIHNTCNHHHSLISREEVRSLVSSGADISNNVKVAWLGVSKWKVGAAAALVFYSYINFKIAETNNFLSNSNSWHCWKIELNLEDFFDIPQQSLSEQLVRDIQKKYASEANPTDFFGPLIAFSNDIKHELNRLEYYLRLVNHIESFNAKRGFMELKPILAKSKLQKLKYINSLFKTWSSEFKAQKIERFYIRKRMKEASLAS